MLILIILFYSNINVFKGIIKSQNIIINGKNFYDQSIDSDVKRYLEIRNSATGQGENYTTGYLLDYDYIKNHYRIIAVDLSRQGILDADPKVIQQIEFVGRLKNPDYATVANESMVALTILERVKKRD